MHVLSRPVKYLVVLVDGTWSSRGKRKTLISLLRTILHSDNVSMFYKSGVGTLSGLSDKILGGALGAGLKKILFDCFAWLAENYHPGYEIILIGYSRGAYICRSLAGLIALVGLPRSVDDEDACDKLFKAYVCGQLRDHDRVAELKTKYNCYDHVSIGFLGCFDTVGTLGIPTTGILGYLNIYNVWGRRFLFHCTNPATNCRRIFHGLGLHETNDAFRATMMHIPASSAQILVQVWFSGSHHNLGRITPGSNLVLFPLAACLQELKNEYPDFPLNEAALGKYFSAYAKPQEEASTESSDEDANFTVAPICSTNTGLMNLLGVSKRAPGSQVRPGHVTKETICRSVRMREDALSAKVKTSLVGGSVVPNLHRVHVDGKWLWVGSTGLSGIALKEYNPGDLMKALLGWENE